MGEGKSGLALVTLALILLWTELEEDKLFGLDLGSEIGGVFIEHDVVLPPIQGDELSLLRASPQPISMGEEVVLPGLPTKEEAGCRGCSSGLADE